MNVATDISVTGSPKSTVPSASQLAAKQAASAHGGSDTPVSFRGMLGDQLLQQADPGNAGATAEVSTLQPPAQPSVQPPVQPSSQVPDGAPQQTASGSLNGAQSPPLVSSLSVSTQDLAARSSAKSAGTPTLGLEQTTQPGIGASIPSPRPMKQHLLDPGSAPIASPTDALAALVLPAFYDPLTAQTNPALSQAGIGVPVAVAGAAEPSVSADKSLSLDRFPGTAADLPGSDSTSVGSASWAEFPASSMSQSASQALGDLLVAPELAVSTGQPQATPSPQREHLTGVVKPASLSGLGPALPASPNATPSLSQLQSDPSWQESPATALGLANQAPKSQANAAAGTYQLSGEFKPTSLPPVDSAHPASASVSPSGVAPASATTGKSESGQSFSAAVPSPAAIAHNPAIARNSFGSEPSPAARELTKPLPGDAAMGIHGALAGRDLQANSTAASGGFSTSISASVGSPGNPSNDGWHGTRVQTDVSHAEDKNFFTQMDSPVPGAGGARAANAGLGAATMLHASSREMDVGVHDPLYGWVEVKAQMVSGQVSASISASTATASHALAAQLPAMANYLSQREVDVSSLGVATHAGGGDGGLRDQGGHSGSREQPSQPQPTGLESLPASRNSAMDDIAQGMYTTGFVSGIRVVA